VLRSDRHGRLTIQVPLGPSNTVQEYPGGGPALGTTIYTTRVTVRRVPVKRHRHK